MLRNAAREVKKHVPEGFGVTVFVFPFDEPDDQTRIFYISTANRRSMISAVHEWLKRQTQ